MVTITELRRLIPGITDECLGNVAEFERDAVAFVEKQTRVYFGSRDDYQEILTGNGSGKLYLTYGAVDAVLDDEYFDTGLVVEERAAAGDDWTTITDFDVRVLEGETVLVRHSTCFTRGYEYRVSQMRGWEEGEEPGDIRALVIRLVKKAFDAMSSDANLRSETIGGYSYTYSTSDLEDDDLATIKAWRRIVYA